MGSRHLPWRHPDLDPGCARAGAGRPALTAMPSASYSSCSDLRVSSMKSCCSFSLQ